MVSDPSAPKGFVKGVLESVDFIINKHGIIEQKEIDFSIDKYKQLLQKSSKEEVNTAMKTIISDILNKVKL